MAVVTYPCLTLLVKGAPDMQRAIILQWCMQLGRWVNCRVSTMRIRGKMTKICSTSQVLCTWSAFVVCCCSMPILSISLHYSDVIMSTITSQIICVSIVCSTVCAGADQRIHHSSASLAFVTGIHHRLPVDFSHKGPATWKIFPFDDVIMFKIPSLTLGAITRLPHCQWSNLEVYK